MAGAEQLDVCPGGRDVAADADAADAAAAAAAPAASPGATAGAAAPTAAANTGDALNPAAAAPGPAAPGAPPLCRHWGRTGACLQGALCRFAHPEGIVPVPVPQRRTWGGARATVRNRSKATVLRRHVIDAFGREALARGSGVLDVAGGKGEISFQLVNLNGIPSTVLDPRPLRLRQFQLRAAKGIYHNEGPYRPYVDTPLEALRRDGPHAPGHARLFLEPKLVEALGRLADARRARRALEGERAGEAWLQSQRPQGEQCNRPDATGGARGAAGREAACVARALALVAESCSRADTVDWTVQGLQEHEGREGGGARRLRSRRGRRVFAWPGSDGGEEDEEEEDEGGEEPAGAEAGPALAAAATCPEHGSGGSEGDGGAASSPPMEGGPAAAAAAAAGAADAEPPPAAGEPAPLAGTAGAAPPSEPCPAADAAGACAGAAAGVSIEPSPADLLATLLDCSCVVSMHPDAATEPAVRLALALGVPYAVVPCCVYGAQFPKRRLPSSGAPVRSHGELVRFIVELTEAAGRRAEVAALPFEGKNVCVWSPAPEGARADAGAG